MKKKLVIGFLTLAIVGTTMKTPVLVSHASETKKDTNITTNLNISSMQKFSYSTNSYKGSYYTGTIDESGVRFRSSPKISSTNIIRTFTKGEVIGVYQTDINCKYADGYWWSYIEDSNGTKGYVASIYFSTDGYE